MLTFFRFLFTLYALCGQVCTHQKLKLKIHIEFDMRKERSLLRERPNLRSRNFNRFTFGTRQFLWVRFGHEIHLLISTYYRVREFRLIQFPFI